MRQTHLTPALLLPALSVLLASCGGYGGGGNYMGAGGGGATCGGAYGTACPAPTVSLTAPAAGTTVSGMSVALTATATASSTYNLTISRVDFMVDGTMVGSAMASPYTVNWDSTKVAMGTHSITAKATDSAGDTATSTPVTVTVQNMAALSATLSSAQMLTGSASNATGTAHVEVSLETGAARGTVTLKGIEATSVTLNEAFAGARGAAVLALAPRGASTSEWDVPAGALLTAEQLVALQQGKLYVLARSARHPEGEVRGQLVPENIVVTFSKLTASPAARSLGLSAGGVAATTVDTRARTVGIEVNARGIDDAMAAHLAPGAGTRPVELTKDSVDMGHWSAELAGLTPANVASFRAGQWSVSVATPVLPEGAIEGAVEAPPSD